ncbi:uncharacterized protein [Paralichthys olivaceus]|uniref:uncharacterized protein n=1 Tax=Paralichthys olivaceus TaxID=8255 RepID=UPI00375245AF
MDSQLASVLTSGSLDAQNGSWCAGGPEAVTGGCLDSEDKTSLSTVPGNLQPCPVTAAVTIITQDAPPVNGRKPEGGGNSKPASQETSKIGGLRRPITVKTGVPALRSQPIRIKIVVPPRCERPITNSAISQTKDFAHTRFRRPGLVSTGAGRHRDKIQMPAVKHGAGLKEVVCQKVEDHEEESFQETEMDRGDTMCREGDVLDVPETLTDKTHIWKMIKEETTEGEIETNILQEMHLETFGEVEIEEQMEPLDLSLPKNKEGLQRRCGQCVDDSGCETSLIMEVDEYEGDGDRDIVEEDDNHEHGTDTLEDSLLSPSFFSTSVFTSLPSIDCDTDDLLLIDDQGIPYTLSPEGVKLPQVDASTSEDPRSDQARSAQVEGKESSELAEPSLSQSLDNALSDMTPDTESPSLGADLTKAPDALTSLIMNSDPSKASESNIKVVQEANAALSPPTGISVPSQPIQILTNPSTNAPILLLSSSSSSPQLSSAPVGLSLPLSVAQTSPGASTPMFLLLSSVPSSSGDTTSTPIAVLDPSTGQLSQITAASAPVSLPLSCGQVSALGSPLPTLSHPVIRLGASDPPVVLSGVHNVNSGSALSVSLSTPALQSDHNSTAPTLHTQNTSTDSNPGSEAISAEGISNENNKPSTFAESSPHLPSANMTFDPSAQPSSEAEAQSPSSESRFDPCDLHSEHLPLDDHLYFSNMAAPPSPPIGPILPMDKLDPLDPLSPAASPNTLAARRVLYCQLCPRVFFYLSDLERHAITHSQKKPHVCQQCGKAFKRSSHLQRHKHIHTGQRNFVCPICAKRFREAGELQRHQRVHTGEKPYQCQLCHTRFAERNTLRRHTKRKHPYHQVAMEMLNERKDRGGGGGGSGVSGVQEEEESAEWYSSTVSNLENSESEMES